LDKAIQSKLLELYNDCWRQEDLPVLDASGLKAHLVWEFLEVSASSVVPVKYGYHPGDLDCWHIVEVEVGAGLRYRGSHVHG
jgi:hypothetical protein